MTLAATVLRESVTPSHEVSNRGAEKSAIARDFGAASKTYNPSARLQHYMGQVMLDRIQPRQPSAMDATDPEAPGALTTLDLGCGTGWFTRAVSDQYGAQRCIGLDLSPGMLAYARGVGDPFIHWLSADAESIPLPDQSVDLIFSNLMIQWAANPVSVLRECLRILRPGGQLHISTLLDGTLRELRQAWYQADPGHEHVNRFDTETTFRQNALEVFPGADVTTETVQLDYPSPMALLSELKSIGAGFKGGERRTSATAPGRLRSMCRQYPRAPGQSAKNEVIASYEAAWLYYCCPE